MTSTNQNIEQLLLQCKSNDQRAQLEVYNRYNKAMYNTCLRFVKVQEEAEDILQESFLSAFNKIGSYRADAAFGSWLKRIVVNNAINHIRKRKIELFELNENHDYIEDVQESNDSETNMNVNKIKEGIQLLPDGFRTVLSLYLLEGYDHKEIGTALGISESTSKSQYMRAKKKLKLMLEIN